MARLRSELQPSLFDGVLHTRPDLGNKAQDALKSMLGGSEISWVGKGRIGAKETEEVRRSPFVRPIIEAVAMDVSNLQFSCTEESTGWQRAVWQDFLDNKFNRVMQELVMWSWCYGQAWADPVVKFDGLNYYFDGFVPLYMPMVDAKKSDALKYGQTMIEKSRCLEVTLFTEAGKPIPFAGMLWKFVAMLDLTFDSWVRSTNINSLGNLYWRFDPQFGLPSEADYTLLKAYNLKHNRSVGLAWVPPAGWYADYRAATTQTASFKELCDRLTAILFQTMRSQYLMTALTTPGTMGSMEVQAQFYNRYIDNLGWLVVEALNKMAEKMAAWNIEPCTVSFTVGRDVSRSRSYNDLAIIPALVQVLTVMGQLDKQQVEAVFNVLGLPPPSKMPDQVPVDQPPPQEAAGQDDAVEVADDPEAMPVGADLEDVANWLKKKGSQVKALFLDFLQRIYNDKRVRKIELHGFDNLWKLLGLDGDKQSTVLAKWEGAEMDINTLLRFLGLSDDTWAQVSKAGKEGYDSIWNDFTRDLLTFVTQCRRRTQWQD